MAGLSVGGKIALEHFIVDHCYQEEGVRLLLFVPGSQNDGVRTMIRCCNARESLIELTEASQSLPKTHQGRGSRFVAMIQSASDFKFDITCASEQDERWNYQLFYSPSDSSILARNVSGKPLAIYPSNGSPNGERLDTGDTERLTVGVWHLELSSGAVVDLRVLRKPSLSFRSVETESTTDSRLLELRESCAEMISSDSSSTTDEDYAISSQFFDIREGQTVELPALLNTAAYEITKTKSIALQSTSEVFLASHSHYSSSIAVKVVRTERSTENNERLIEMIENFARECHIHESLQHSSIVQFLDCDARFLSAYLEYLPGADLARASWRDANDICRASRDEAMEVWKQIADALSFIHYLDISHNDIKPGNIIAHGSGTALKASLCDFGISLKASASSFNGGTRWYIPAEHISTGQRGNSGDIWAFGVTMLFVLGHMPLPEVRNNHFRSDYLAWKISETRRSSGAAEKMMSWIREITAVLGSLTLETEPCLDILRGMLEENPNHRLMAPHLVKKLYAYEKASERS